MNVKKEKTSVTLDEILIKFKKCGFYYCSTVVLLSLAGLMNGLYSFNYVFVAEYVKYRCKDERFANATCSSVQFNNSIESCTEWVYEKPNSFVAEFQLACQEWKRTLVATMHNVGYMIGLLIIGPLSDRWGRKTLLVTTGVTGAALGLARSFSTSYWMFIALEFLEGAIGDISSPLFMMSIEMVASEQRLTFAMISACGFSISLMISPLAAWSIPYWRSLLRALYTPSFLFIFYYFLLHESPRWLLSRGYKEETIEFLIKMSKKDNIELDKQVLERISHDEDKTDGLFKLIKKSFKSDAIVKRFYVCLTWWIVCTFVAHGMQLNCTFLAGNKYINYSFFMIDDLLGQVVSNFIMRRYRRKIPLICCFFLGAIFCTIQPFVPLEQPWLSVLFFMIGNLMLTCYFNITYIFTSELFPTYTRNSMHALCSSVGRIGSILAPQTPLLMIYWKGLPSLLFGVASLLGGIVTFFIPDIADSSLPDTVRQAEELDFEKKDEPKAIEF